MLRWVPSCEFTRRDRYRVIVAILPCPRQENQKCRDPHVCESPRFSPGSIYPCGLARVRRMEPLGPMSARARIELQTGLSGIDGGPSRVSRATRGSIRTQDFPEKSPVSDAARPALSSPFEFFLRGRRQRRTVCIRLGSRPGKLARPEHEGAHCPPRARRRWGHMLHVAFAGTGRVKCMHRAKAPVGRGGASGGISAAPLTAATACRCWRIVP